MENMNTTAMSTTVRHERPVAEEFKGLCRRWRKYRKLSQLELSLSAEISQRHLSWLETGRSRPSRDMVLRICKAMDIPLRERNRLFRSAGFAQVYGESALEDPDMAPVLDALDLMLNHHDPFPAVVVDRLWNVKKTNQSAASLLELLSASGVDPASVWVGDALNLALLSLHPQGLRQVLSNWSEIAGPLIHRLRCETSSSGDSEVINRLNQFIELAGPVVNVDPGPEGLLPVLPLCLELNGVTLRLFSVISTFGTPQDITTDELRIETFYPADEASRLFFTHKEQ